MHSLLASIDAPILEIGMAVVGCMLGLTVAARTRTNGFMQLPPALTATVFAVVMVLFADTIAILGCLALAALALWYIHDKWPDIRHVLQHVPQLIDWITRRRPSKSLGQMLRVEQQRIEEEQEYIRSIPDPITRRRLLDQHSNTSRERLQRITNQHIQRDVRRP